MRRYCGLLAVALPVAGLATPLDATATSRCPTTGVAVARYLAVGGPHVLAKLLGRRPPSDAVTRGCANGGDGRLDLWLVPSHPRLRPGVTAAFLPYSGEPCDPKQPGAIVLRGTAKRTTVAHEVFHAFQAGFRKATPCINYTEWDEDTATWAMDYAYPKELGEIHLGNLKMDYALEGIFGYDG